MSKRFLYPWWVLLLRAPLALVVLPFSFFWHFSLSQGWQVGEELADALKEWADDWVRRRRGEGPK